MLEEIKLNELDRFVKELSREELVWLNGYVSGLLKSYFQEEGGVTTATPKLTIAYGTETGNAKKLAIEFVSQAQKFGLKTKLCALDQYRVADLRKEEHFILVVSTHGEGEPPSAAKNFFEFLYNDKPDLSKLQYSVLALGDSAYPLFCKAGEDADLQLEKLGARRVSTLIKCDTDFENDARLWFNHTIEQIKNRSTSAVEIKQQKKTVKRNYTGTISRNINLNGEGSAKETHHIEIQADGLDYKPGDAIGIVARNSTAAIDSIVSITGLDLAQIIKYKNEEQSISELLSTKLSITYLSERVVAKYAVIVEQNIPEVRIDFVDLLKIYPPLNEEKAIEAIKILEPLSPRLYSISSSLSAYDEEVHITVARNCFEVAGIEKYGLCSNFLSQLKEGDRIEFYVNKNQQFKLPSPETDIIMIGPGTGVAPFRAFVQERVSTGATGKNWLFFGDQHFTSDFLYQTEWQDLINTGRLTKMNVAFSRDQTEKIYVQHKMIQHGKEIFQWINNGAFVYVCGSKEPMSSDVENALMEILETAGQLSKIEANEYLSQLKDEGRYLKDVY